VRISAAQHTPRVATALRHLPCVAPAFMLQVCAMKAE
jgi:hypothetical protein